MPSAVDSYSHIDREVCALKAWKAAVITLGAVSAVSDIFWLVMYIEAELGLRQKDMGRFD